jgi:hypothetical protein
VGGGVCDGGYSWAEGLRSGAGPRDLALCEHPAPDLPLTHPLAFRTSRPDRTVGPGFISDIDAPPLTEKASCQGLL